MISRSDSSAGEFVSAIWVSAAGKGFLWKGNRTEVGTGVRGDRLRLGVNGATFTIYAVTDGDYYVYSTNSSIAGSDTVVTASAGEALIAVVTTGASGFYSYGYAVAL